jgi:hypothetical protein
MSQPYYFDLANFRLEKTYTGRFKTFGIQSISGTHLSDPNSLQTAPPMLSKTVKEDLGADLIPSHGFIQTRASLQNVRRIRVSQGASGHFRSSDYNTGLWLEYCNEDKSEIVGQWIREAESWELAKDEKILGLSFWTSEDRILVGLPYHPSLGRVVGIAMQTTASEFRIFASAPQKSVNINYKANRLECLVRIESHTIHP